MSEALVRTVDWRAGILNELMLSGIPEVEDPTLLAELLETLVENEYQRRMGLILTYHALGDQNKSDALLQEWIEAGWERSLFHVAYTLAYRGDTDLAFEMLYKVAAMGQVSNAAAHPFLLSLHADPRWLLFLENIGKSPQQLAGFELDLTWY